MSTAGWSQRGLWRGLREKAGPWGRQRGPGRMGLLASRCRVSAGPVVPGREALLGQSTGVAQGVPAAGPSLGWSTREQPGLWALVTRSKRTAAASAWGCPGSRQFQGCQPLTSRSR